MKNKPTIAKGTANGNCNGIANGLGNAIRDALDDQYDAQRESELKDAVVAAAFRKPLSVQRRRPTWAFAAAVAAAATVVVVLWHVIPHGNQQKLLFKTAPQAPWQSGDHFENTGPAQKNTILFSDNSQIGLLPNSGLHIAKATTEAVRLYLDSGQISAKINSTPGTRWSLYAGPFKVTVLGTVFSMNWLEKPKQLMVFVKEGTVLVEGQGIADGGVKVTSTNRFVGTENSYTVDRPSGTPSPVSTPLVDAPINAATVDNTENKDEKREINATPTQQSSESRSTIKKEKPQRKVETQNWEELCRSGKYNSIMTNMSPNNINEIETSGNIDELWCVAKAARYSGNGRVAKRLLVAVRSRFGQTQRAKLAAFFLGAVNADLLDNPDSAKYWFKMYLKEAPKGALADEARGKLVD